MKSYCTYEETKWNDMKFCLFLVSLNKWKLNYCVDKFFCKTKKNAQNWKHYTNRMSKSHETISLIIRALAIFSWSTGTFWILFKLDFLMLGIGVLFFYCSSSNCFETHLIPTNIQTGFGYMRKHVVFAIYYTQMGTSPTSSDILLYIANTEKK
jgi:uncharacterized membrane protein